MKLVCIVWVGALDDPPCFVRISLAEEMGLDEFNAELKKNSDYYTKNFFFK